MEAEAIKDSLIIAVSITGAFMLLTFIIAYGIANKTANKMIKNQIDITRIYLNSFQE